MNAGSKWWTGRRAQGVRARASSRVGGVLSVELLLTLPVLLALTLAAVEFGFLAASHFRLEAAAMAACREAALAPAEESTPPAPANEEPPSPAEPPSAVEQAAIRSLSHKYLVAAHELKVCPGRHTGDAVAVEIRVPMTAAAPDMLAMFGFSLRGRYLSARCVLRKE